MKASDERGLAERYFDRLTKLGPSVGLEFAGVIETPESKARNAAARKREEARKLAETVGDGMLILLDERGKDLTSQEFGERLATFRDDGAKRLTIAIGGADGHDGTMRAKADLCLSFGAQTWPHQLVRVMLAEQLYRAATILAGHPYHRA